MRTWIPFLGLAMIVSLPGSAQFHESFEQGLFPPSGWTTFIGTNGAGTAYNWESSTAYHSNGIRSAFVRWEQSGQLNEDWLVTPLITLSGTGNVLTFDGRDEYQTFNYGALYYVLVSTTSQTSIASFDTLSTYTEANMGPGFQSFTISLSAYDGQSVYIAFMLASDYADSWAVDNITIGQPITCPAPTTFTVSNITGVSADFSWNSNGSGTSWQLEYDLPGFSPGIGAGTSVLASGTMTYTVSGLLPTSSYEVYVREICNTGDTSFWYGPVGFTTPVACPVPTNPGIAHLTETTALIYWDGGNNSAWRVQWGPPGFNMATGTGALGFSNTTNDTVLITGLAATTSYEFTVETDCTPSGFGYSSPTANVPFTTTCPTASLPFSEDFNSATGCMSVQVGGNSLNTWEHLTYYTTPSENLDGSMFYMISSDAAGNGIHMDDYLTTPYIDASGLSGTLFLEFDQYFLPYAFGDPELAEVEVWDGSSWHVVLSMDENIGPQGGWGAPDHRSINITPYANDSVQVRFHYHNTLWEYFWAVDNVEIREVDCLDPTSIATYGVGTDSISLTWDGLNGVNWSVEYGPGNFTPGTGTLISLTDTFFTASGLTHSTSYDFYFQSECALGQTSDWIGPLSLNTLCDVFPLPWSEGFENIGDNGFALCMDTTLGWVLDTGALTYNRMPHTGSGYIYGKWSMDGWIFSPEFYLEANTSYTFSFWYITDGNSGWDQVDVAFGTSPTASGMTHAIGAPLEGATNTSYQQYSVTFSPLTDGNYYLGTHLQSGSSPWYFTLDDFHLEESVACAAPQPLEVSNLNSQSADLQWGAVGSTWEISWGPIGFYQGTTTVNGTLIGGITSPLYTMNNLGSDSCYSVYVRSICGTDTSDWSPRLDFCTPPTCPAPSQPGLQFVNPTSASIYWTTGGAAFWNISYGPSGVLPGTGTLVSATNDTTTLTGLLPGTSYEFYIQDSCGAGDLSAWVGPFGFQTPCLIQPLPYLETFATNLGCFERQIGGSSSESWKWEHDHSGSLLGGSAGYMIIDSEAAGSGNHQNDYAYSPAINASGLTSGDTLILSFNQYFNDWFAGNDSAIVDVWDGTQWVNLVTQAGSSVGSWASPDFQELDITAYANGSLKVRFHYRGAWDWYWAVDSVYIGLKTSCSAPLNTTVSNVMCTEAEVSWVTSSSGLDMELQHGPAGFIPGFGTSVTGATSPLLLTGLAPGSDYDVYLRTICSVGDTSDWTGVTSFQSASGPLPTLNFGWSQTGTTLSSGEITFNASGTSNADTIYWSLSGDTLGGDQVVHNYNSNGTYPVTVTAGNSCGTVDSTFDVSLVGISVHETDLERSLLIYPNPTSGTLTVRLSGQPCNHASIKVTNSVGQIIAEAVIRTIPVFFEHSIELADRPKGVYFIEVTTEYGSVHRPFIKQ